MAFKLLKIDGFLGFNYFLKTYPDKVASQQFAPPKMAVDAFTNIYFRKIEIKSDLNSQLWVKKISD